MNMCIKKPQTITHRRSLVQSCLLEVKEEREEIVEEEELVASEEIQELFNLELCTNKLNLQLKFYLLQEKWERMETQANQEKAESMAVFDFSGGMVIFQQCFTEITTKCYRIHNGEELMEQLQNNQLHQISSLNCQKRQAMRKSSTMKNIWLLF